MSEPENPSEEALVKGPWPASKAEERMLRAVAAMLALVMETEGMSDEVMMGNEKALVDVGLAALTSEEPCRGAE